MTLSKASNEGLTCRVAHKGLLLEPFEVRTGEQGCLHSLFLFLLITDCLMRSDFKESYNDIQRPRGR